VTARTVGSNAGTTWGLTWQSIPSRSRCWSAACIALCFQRKGWRDPDPPPSPHAAPKHQLFSYHKQSDTDTLPGATSQVSRPWQMEGAQDE
jgi:hypothetical protein